MSYSNQAGAGSINAAREQPILQNNAQAAATEAVRINDRLDVILARLRPPVPTPVTGAERDGQQSTPTLRSVLDAIGRVQSRTGDLLTEIESLV